MRPRPKTDWTTTRSSREEATLPLDADLPDDRKVAALISRLDRAQREQSRTMELGTADLRILWMFADGKSRTLKEIAAELSLEQSTVNRQINAAMAEGLLQRSRRSGDSAHEISRTEKGARIFEDDVVTALTAFASGLDALGDRVDDFLEDFTRFVAAYGSAVRPDDSAVGSDTQ